MDTNTIRKHLVWGNFHYSNSLPLSYLFFITTGSSHEVRKNSWAFSILLKKLWRLNRSHMIMMNIKIKQIYIFSNLNKYSVVFKIECFLLNIDTYNLLSDVFQNWSNLVHEKKHSFVKLERAKLTKTTNH